MKKKKNVDEREQSDRMYVLVEARGIFQYCKDHWSKGDGPCECPFFDKLYECSLSDFEWCLLGVPYFWDMETVERRAKGMDDE